MRKLNPFHMPQVASVEPVASTSATSPPSMEKQILTVEVPMEIQPCTSNPDLFNIVLAEQQLHADSSRPRQYGRRSNPVRLSSFAIDSSNNGAAVRWKQRDMMMENLI